MEPLNTNLQKNVSKKISNIGFPISYCRLRWAMLNDWTDCNETCGDHGFQEQLYKCERDVNGKIEHIGLTVCDEVLPPPKYTRACNRVPCKVFNWVESEKWSECSHTCGNSGEKTKIYHCEDSAKRKVEDKYCKGPKPVKTEECNRMPCVNEWYKYVSTEAWGPCSATCGDSSYQSRLKECVRFNSNNETEKVSMSHCSNLLEEDDIRPCNFVPCYQATYRWIVVADWSECSTECGTEGIQYQLNKCFDVTFEYAMKNVEDVFCDESSSGNATRPCNRVDCFNYEWVSQTWGECSATCGSNGIRKQLFSCSKVYLNKTIQDVDASFCNHLQIPLITENCNRAPCERTIYSWITLPDWTSCSVTCGKGTEEAQFGCFAVHKNDTMTRVENETLCRISAKPVNQRPCDRGSCESYRWSEVFDWTACSASCGEEGVQRKIHVCEHVSKDGSIIPTSSSFCENLPDISEIRPCNRMPCVSWRYRVRHVPYLSDCSETCGDSGVSFYQYVCEKEFVNGTLEEVKMENCANIVFPNTTYPCNRVSCGRQWVAGEWGRVCSILLFIGFFLVLHLSMNL